MKTWIARFAVVAGCMLACAEVTSAARLELLDQQRTENTTPPTSVLEPCTSTVNQNIDQFIEPNGQGASTTVAQSIALTANAIDCSINVTATQSSLQLFTLAPDAGESVGDDVLFCLRASFRESASSDGNYAAQSTIGGGSGVGPATVIRNPSGSAMTVFSFGPATVLANQPPVSEHATQQFSAQIGDEIRIELGDAATANGTGVGAASVDASSRIELQVGTCATAAPAMAPVGMAALVVLLTAVGVLALRWRR